MRIIRRLMLALCWIVGMQSIGTAADPANTGASSSAAAKQDAIHRIPFRELNASARSKLENVLDNPSMFRRMPTQTVECDPEMFTFLVRHPEAMVNIWDLMGVTKVAVNRLNPFVFQGHDGAGTTCQAELIYGTDELHIYYGHGTYDGPMVPKELKGRCVCVLHGKPLPQNKNMMVGQMDVFIKLDNIGADLVARTISPFVSKTADYNFVESARFVSQISQAAERNPLAMQQLVSKLNKLDPNVREEFSKVARNVAIKGMADQQAGLENSEPSGDAFLIDQLKSNGQRVPSNQTTLRPEKLDLQLRR